MKPPIVLDEISPTSQSTMNSAAKLSNIASVRIAKKLSFRLLDQIVLNLFDTINALGNFGRFVHLHLRIHKT